MDEQLKKGMFILVMLIILVSVIGTLTFLGAIDTGSGSAPIENSKGSATGEIRLVIEKPPVSKTTGQVVLNIERRK